MHALIDGDIPLYEASSIGTDKETGEVHSWEYVESIFLNKIREICSSVGATSYTLFLTGKGNFREKVATLKPYKGTRVNEKPFHYDNLKAYMLSLPETVLVEGMEADDAMAIAQMAALRDDPYDYAAGKLLKNATTIICTRDKDLRQVPGWHYGWEMGAQPEFKPTFVDVIGNIELVRKYREDGTVKSSKVTGVGAKFFYAQLITGDTVDNIPGLPGVGAVTAYEVLNEAETEYDMYQAVYALYEKKYTGEANVRLREQAYLLWMVREVDEEGQPVMWVPPERKEEPID